jgi:hypothetical protein
MVNCDDGLPTGSAMEGNSVLLQANTLSVPEMISAQFFIVMWFYVAEAEWLLFLKSMIHSPYAWQIDKHQNLMHLLIMLRKASDKLAGMMLLPCGQYDLELTRIAA